MKIIPLSQGKFTLVDDKDFEWLTQWKWTFLSSGYAYRFTARPERRLILMHRLIMGAETGQEIDHINGNKLDNQRTNLRFCTSSQNKMNHTIHRNNTSGVAGVYLDKRYGKYQVYINANRKRISLGYFKTLDEAKYAREEAVKKHHGEFART